MTTRAAVRRSLLAALTDLERVDDAALDEAFRHAQRAAFGILDLRGTGRPIPLDRLPKQSTAGGEP